MITAPMASTRGLNESTLQRGRGSRLTTPFRVDDAVGEDQERRDRDEDDRDTGRDEEASVDGRHARAVAGARGHGEDADDRGEHADRRDDQRVDEADVAEGHLAEDQRGDEGDGVRLEEVGRHAGAVADVVADVVRDGRGVARVVLGDALLDLADEVGADVGGLGEDAAADTHEHREQRGAEAEALEHGRGRRPCRAGRRAQHRTGRGPTVNMPATPPVRNAICIAACSPESLAAAATRTLPRTASHMPT